MAQPRRRKGIASSGIYTTNSMIGKIYRIVHLQSEMCYIGSTFNLLKHRWNGHKSQFKHWDEGKTTKGCSIYPYFKEHGIDQFKMVLIKEYEVADRAQLLAYEQLWIIAFEGHASIKSKRSGY
ncbi:GIY-YIG domain [Phytophthora cactorum]|nr:GIY-YIG domain [Phytophthora cactorum]KAF1786062.1 GIY-YIG domain [Phytophthora cactorum]